MKVDIVIPTYKRYEKATKCLNTVAEACSKILTDNDVHVHIFCSDSDDLANLRSYLQYSFYMQADWLPIVYEASTFWNYYISQNNFDVMFYLNDDILVHPDCFKNALDTMTEYFPDLDGLVGLRQENIPLGDCCLAAFGAVGKKFVDRFKNRKLFCEDYKYFYLDKELWEYAKSVNKFIFNNECKIFHLHPSYCTLKADTTHFKIRKTIDKDRLTYIKRKDKKLLWGRDSETVKPTMSNKE